MPRRSTTSCRSHRSRRSRPVTLVVGAMIAGSTARFAAAQPPTPPGPCGSPATCPDSTLFVVVPTAIVVAPRDAGGPLQATVQATVTVRVFNAARRPLTLEFPRQGASLSDDTRNLYTVPSDAAVHGIGFVRGPVVDSQFTVAPGQTRDLSIDFVPRDARARVLGPRFAFAITLTPVRIGPTGRVEFGAPGSTSLQGLAPGPEVAAYADRVIAAVRSARASCGNDLPCLGRAFGAVGTSSASTAVGASSAAITGAAARGAATAAATPPTSDTATGTGAGARSVASGSAGGSVPNGVSIGGIPGATLGSIRSSATSAAQDVAGTAVSTTTDLATSAADSAAKAAAGKIDDARAKADSTIARTRARVQKALPKWMRPER